MAGKKALLTITQTGDLDSSSEYTTLYARGGLSRLADCISGTSSWATPAQCSGLDVTQYVSSSGTLALKLDCVQTLGVSILSNPRMVCNVTDPAVSRKLSKFGRLELVHIEGLPPPATQWSNIIKVSA